MFCITLLSLSGCSRKVADINLPSDTDTLHTFSLPGVTEAPDRWWLSFDDPELHILIDSALQLNLPLEGGWHQFREARALVETASSARVPDIFYSSVAGLVFRNLIL